MSCRALDDARDDSNFWLTTLRRTGRRILDPEYVRDSFEAQARERALMSEVDLGEAAHFLLIRFGVHRIWAIGVTTKYSGPHGMNHKRTYAVLEWETGRSLRGIDPAPCVGWKTILPQHLLDAVLHPVAPADASSALARYAPKAADTIDIEGLDALGILRVFDYIMRSGAMPGDVLALRRAYRHALLMRDNVRWCFSRRPDLWSGEPVRDIWS